MVGFEFRSLILHRLVVVLGSRYCQLLSFMCFKGPSKGHATSLRLWAMWRVTYSKSLTCRQQKTTFSLRKQRILPCCQPLAGRDASLDFPHGLEHRTKIKHCWKAMRLRSTVPWVTSKISDLQGWTIFFMFFWDVETSKDKLSSEEVTERLSLWQTEFFTVFCMLHLFWSSTKKCFSFLFRPHCFL